MYYIVKSIKSLNNLEVTKSKYNDLASEIELYVYRLDFDIMGYIVFHSKMVLLGNSPHFLFSYIQ